MVEFELPEFIHNLRLKAHNANTAKKKEKLNAEIKKIIHECYPESRDKKYTLNFKSRTSILQIS